MEDKKLKLIEYLHKNLEIARKAVEEIAEVGDAIVEAHKRLAELEARAAELGNKEEAIAVVDEIQGYIDMFNEPEHTEVEDIEGGEQDKAVMDESVEEVIEPAVEEPTL